MGKAHWFTYVRKTINNCLLREGKTGKITKLDNECHKAVLQSNMLFDFDGMITYDDKQYKQCFDKQKKILQDAANDFSYNFAMSGSYLDRDHQLRQELGASFHPSMSVNNQTYRGDYSHAVWI